MEKYRYQMSKLLLDMQSKLGTSGDRQFITKAEDIKHIKLVGQSYIHIYI